MVQDKRRGGVTATAQRHLEQRAFVIVVLVALALKTVYLAQYIELPFLYGPLFDAQVYLVQARRVLAGEFGDPTLLAMSPLYGYWLALLQAGQASIVPVLAQLALGTLNLVLLRAITTRLFGATAALVAVILYLAYGPLLFFESKIMSETLGLSLLLLTFERMTSADFGRGRPWACGVAGACLALAVLARASLLLTMPLLVAAAWGMRAPNAVAAPRARTQGRAWRSLIFAGGIMLVLVGHGGWTKLHSGLFVPVILVSNTAARATHVEWRGDLSIFRAEGEQQVGAFSVVQQARQRLARLRRGEAEPPREPPALVPLLMQAPKKLWLTLRDRETSFDYGFYGERTEVPALYVCFASFGVVLGFGLLGLATTVQRRRTLDALPLLAVIAGTLLTTMLFHPSTRYRLPLVVALLPLAGHGCSAVLRITNVRQRVLALNLCAAFALAFAVNHALRPLQQPGMWELRVAEAAIEEGNGPLAHARIDRALALEPRSQAVRRRAAYLLSRVSGER